MKQLWIDTRLNEEEMNFLNDTISEENMRGIKRKIKDFSEGGLRKYSDLVDKDNWFFKSVLKKLTERMFYRDWDNYYKYHIEKEEPQLPEFEMNSFWVNYQKQHEFNPIHHHFGLFSFVIFVKIPTHWEEQHALPISANSNAPVASDFAFVWSANNSEECFPINFPLSPEDEGRILFFPAEMKHMVYPFYGTEEERITISGNINFVIPKEIENEYSNDSVMPSSSVIPSMPTPEFELSSDVYEEKEKILKILENSVKVTKKELNEIMTRMMKEKDG